MAWLGKILGGAIGFAMGGPLGAVAGAVFGHAFDKNDDNDSQSRSWLGWSSIEQAESTFFLAAFSMLAKLVHSDGKIAQKELETIHKFMVQDLNLDIQSQQVAVSIFNTALQSSHPFESYAEQFYQQFRNEPQMLRLMVDLLLRVAASDGSISPAEDTIILSAIRIFHFSEDQYRLIRSRYFREPNRYYAVLECTPKDTDDKIKSNYRKLVREYHPDTIASKGLPPEFTTFAQKKFVEIQEAYEAIKKERGIK
jgi:DnaJ like chaperone protein